MIFRGTEQITLTLTQDVISFLKTLPKGRRSRWVNSKLRQHIDTEAGCPNLDLLDDLVGDINNMLQKINWRKDEPDYNLDRIRANFREPELLKTDTVYGLYKFQWVRRAVLTQAEYDSLDPDEHDLPTKVRG